jgi:hypothetical protein
MRLAGRLASLLLLLLLLLLRLPLDSMLLFVHVAAQQRFEPLCGSGH